MSDTNDVMQTVRDTVAGAQVACDEKHKLLRERSNAMRSLVRLCTPSTDKVDDLLDEIDCRLQREGDDLEIKAKAAEDAELRRKMATVAKRAEEMAERQEQHVKVILDLKKSYETEQAAHKRERDRFKAELAKLPEAAEREVRSTAGDSRRSLLDTIPRVDALTGLLNPTSEARGYIWLPRNICPELGAAIEFANAALRKNRDTASLDIGKFRSDLLTGTCYEDAPEFFDLTMSDALVQLACDYLGMIPILGRPRLWWSKPGDLIDTTRGTQSFHLGDPKNPGGVRQSKFLFAMDDIVDGSGPLTFFPADTSQRIAEAIDYRMGDRVPDDVIFDLAKDAAPQRFNGRAGSGVMLDTSRCFHYGRRTNTAERLMLMIQFKAPADLLEIDRPWQTPGFEQKYGHDPVRSMMVPAC